MTLITSDMDAPARRRRDIVARRSEDSAGLLRFVVAPDNRLLPDVAERLPGRGLWVKADASSLETAIRRRLFDRQAGTRLEVPADLVAIVEAQLVQRCRELIGLARRAGLLVAGFDQVREVLDRATPGVLIEASDAARHGSGRLRAKHRHGSCIAVLSRDEIGRAIGREAVVHAFLRDGTLAKRLIDTAAKLEGFRPGDEMPDTGDASAQQGMSRET